VKSDNLFALTYAVTLYILLKYGEVTKEQMKSCIHLPQFLFAMFWFLTTRN